MKKLISIIIVLLVIGAGVGAYYYKKGGPEPTITTLQVSRGDIVDQVGATGTLQAVTTVQVGTQVSGIIQDLYADFNSIVKKGQVIARLDPSLLQTALDTAKANLVNAQANLERQKVAVDDANVKLKRAQELFAKNLAPRTDLETAEVAQKQAEAQLKSTQSQIVQAEAAVNKAKVDLDHTIITAPIDGIVTSRNVDKGQTVAASMQAPTIFIIAADLTKMQVNANIDESDVGRMRPGQTVRFRVDAYPNDTFIGTVQQVRLNPTTVQNVVTYSTVIDVPNPDYRLMPGMTANLNIEVARRSNVLRVPNAALRFRPTRDTFTALNQAITPDIERALGGGRGGFGRGGSGRGGDTGGMTGGTRNGAANGQPANGRPPAAGQLAANQSGAAFQRGGGDQASASGGNQGGGRGNFANMTPEERQKRMQERLAQMTPEQRQQFEQRMKDRIAQGGGSGTGQTAQGANGARAQTPQPPAQSGMSKTMAGGGAQTVDALFGPLPVTESRGRVWLDINKQLKPVNLRLGISDGTWTEVLDGNELQPGTEVVTNVATGLETQQRPGNQSPGAGNPLMGPQRGGPGRGR
ncbi:MAG TPA: efflux RND transporter periplasmic adaptor subunit [Vicinamibacterales bacterium]|jgi:HlyD family secretion protein|nr:efflux RND transporter periplasmic adaptor subunit [Vicinamibacterales bacterium]